MGNGWLLSIVRLDVPNASFKSRYVRWRWYNIYNTTTSNTINRNEDNTISMWILRNGNTSDNDMEDERTSHQWELLVHDHLHIEIYCTFLEYPHRTFRMKHKYPNQLVYRTIRYMDCMIRIVLFVYIYRYTFWNVVVYLHWVFKQSTRLQDGWIWCREEHTIYYRYYYR